MVMHTFTRSKEPNMDKPRSSAAPVRTGSYPSAHAGLLLHVRHQVQHGQPQLRVGRDSCKTQPKVS